MTTTSPTDLLASQIDALASAYGISNLDALTLAVRNQTVLLQVQQAYIPPDPIEVFRLLVAPPLVSASTETEPTPAAPRTTRTAPASTVQGQATRTLRAAQSHAVTVERQAFASANRARIIEGAGRQVGPFTSGALAHELGVSSVAVGRVLSEVRWPRRPRRDGGKAPAIVMWMPRSSSAAG